MQVLECRLEIGVIEVRVDVRRGGDVPVPRELLSELHRELCKKEKAFAKIVKIGPVSRSGEAPVHYVHLTPTADHDVPRFEIPMNDATVGWLPRCSSLRAQGRWLPLGEFGIS